MIGGLSNNVEKAARFLTDLSIRTDDGYPVWVVFAPEQNVKKYVVS